MKKKLKFTILTLLTLMLYLFLKNISLEAHANSFKNQNDYIEVLYSNYQREMRGTWVASAWNLHVPNGLDEQGFREWADELTYNLAELNYNAIIFQVRPRGDALYNSDLAPTSHFINGGKQGDPIEYDPLEILIEFSHARGIEVHAWLNPFMATGAGLTFEDLHYSNIAAQNPHWLIHHTNGIHYFNLGIPEFQNHIVDVVMEIVNNYDIDGIHFDDFFYPSSNFADLHTFETYGGDFEDIGDWRRNNVNSIIEKVYYSIKESKPWVQFGISPGPVWRTLNEDPTGADTLGNSTYDRVFADSREWINRGVVDYITPQLYWSTESEFANFLVLNKWWGEQIELYSNTRPVNLFIGTGDYKVNNDPDTSWLDPMQLSTQLQLNRENPYVKGQMHYAVIHLLQNQLNYMDIIQKEFYNTMALTPSIDWIDPTVPNPPNSVIATSVSDGVELKINTNCNNTRRYVIYRFDEHQEVAFKDDNIIGVIFKNNTETFVDSKAIPGHNYKYVVKSISPTGVISKQATSITHTR